MPWFSRTLLIGSEVPLTYGIVLYPRTDSARGLLENHRIKVAFKRYQTISKMFPKPKDQMDKEDTRDPVYDIPCAICSKSYVGETQRKFITGKSEHQRAVARGQGKKSALADHVIKTNHDIAWDEAIILRTSNNGHQKKDSRGLGD